MAAPRSHPPRASRLPLGHGRGATCGVSAASTEGVAVAADLGRTGVAAAREPFRSPPAGATATRTGPIIFACPWRWDSDKMFWQLGWSEASGGGWTARTVTSRRRPVPLDEVHRWSAGVTGRRLTRVAAAAEPAGGRRSRVVEVVSRGAAVEANSDLKSTPPAPQGCKKAAPWPPTSPAERRGEPHRSGNFRMRRTRYPDKRAGRTIMAPAANSLNRVSGACTALTAAGGPEEGTARPRGAVGPSLASRAPPAALHGVLRAPGSGAARIRRLTPVGRTGATWRAGAALAARWLGARVQRVPWYVWGARGTVGAGVRARGAPAGRSFVYLPLFTPFYPPLTQSENAAVPRSRADRRRAHGRRRRGRGRRGRRRLRRWLGRRRRARRPVGAAQSAA